MLQIRRGNRDNLWIISHICHKNIFCDPPLEPSHRDGSKQGSQHMFSLRNKKKLSLNYPQYPLLFGALTESLFTVEYMYTGIYKLT